jgi:hypothetical protein
MTLEETLKGLNCCSEFLCGECPYKAYDSQDYVMRCTHKLIVDLQALESATLKEPEVGKWVPVSSKPGAHAGMKCSICKAKISYRDYYGGQHNYCYKCGAKMVKED